MMNTENTKGTFMELYDHLPHLEGRASLHETSLTVMPLNTLKIDLLFKPISVVGTTNQSQLLHV